MAMERRNRSVSRVANRIYIEDARALGYCRNGIKLRMTRANILRLRELVKGIPFEVALACDDVMVTRMVEQAKKRQKAQGLDNG
jgi:hypothetical protein